MNERIFKGWVGELANDEEVNQWSMYYARSKRTSERWASKQCTTQTNKWTMNEWTKQRLIVPRPKHTSKRVNDDRPEWKSEWTMPGPNGQENDRKSNNERVNNDQLNDERCSTLTDKWTINESTTNDTRFEERSEWVNDWTMIQRTMPGLNARKNEGTTRTMRIVH